jgi:predicted amidophosphoribosyltransferase
VAAFCACCGAEITLKAGACPICGAPQHGMAQPDLLFMPDVEADSSEEDVKIGRKLSKPPFLKRL